MAAITPGQFQAEFATFSSLSRADGRFTPAREDQHPCLLDRTSATGFDRHYVYHTAWAARILAQCRPAAHVDIGSSLFFAGIVSAFVPVSFYDWRPADLRLTNLGCGAADLLHLPFADRSVPSLSCMHVVEHVGLGRYGDPLDAAGDLRGMAELQRVCGGDLLFVVPVGRPRVCFNAHRIYAFRMIRDAFAGLELKEFTLIPEHGRDGGLIVNATEAQADREQYACGCFWFRRPA